jgi:hypothetical protein
MASGTITDRNGTYPLIIYTNDGSITWNKVNPKYFNTSGVGYYINNTTHSVVPTTDNNFVIVNNITNSTETPFQSGNSNILYGYIPNIFNVYTNQVVDVYGGMNVDGKVWQF